MGYKKHALMAIFTCLAVCNVGLGQSSESGSGHHAITGIPFHHGLHRYHNGFIPAYGAYANAYFRPFGPNGFEIADVIRARSEANVNNANARTQNAVAYQMELENNLQRLATYHERRRINTEYRFAHLHAKAESRREQAAMAKAAPSRHIHPQTGGIAWPLILSTKHFERARGPIDAMFADRAAYGAINPDLYLPMCDWIEKIQDELKKQSANYEMNDYMAAQAFLRHLVDEGRKPASEGRSAVALASVK